MAETVIIISVILIFLLILVQDISIRLIYKNGLSIEIDYSFFTLTLSDIKSKGGFSGISPKLFPKLKRRIEFLLRNARLEITEIHLSTSEDDPRKFSLIYKNLFSLFATAIQATASPVQFREVTSISIGRLIARINE